MKTHYIRDGHLLPERRRCERLPKELEPIAGLVNGLAIVAVFWLLALVAVAVAVRAEEGKSPARVAPGHLWGTLEPGAILGDTTHYLFDREPDCVAPNNFPMWFDLDIEGGYMWTVTGSALEGWDLATPNRPTLISKLCKPTLTVWRKADYDWYLVTVEAIGDRVVVGSQWGMGLLVFDVSQPRSPRLIYQYEGVCQGCLSIKDVHVTTIGNKRYAFAAADDLVLYAFALDGDPYFVGKVSGGAQSMSLQSVWKIAGAGALLAVRWGGMTQIWDAADINRPTLIAGTGPNPLDIVAWQQAQSFPLVFATAHGSEVRLHSLVDGKIFTLERLSTPGSMIDTLSVSKDGGRVYLYAGTTRVDGREWLWDVTDPSSPIEFGSAAYWEHYDDYRNTASYAGQVAGGRLYRAAWSLLDVHQLTSQPEPEPEPEVITWCDFEVVQP